MTDKDYLIKGEMYQYNLGWLIKELLSFKQDLATAIDLKTIKYADPIQWDITTQYPANTVVVNPKSGTAYMSKVPVPAGVELTNDNYWVVVFNYQDIYNKIMDGVAFNDRDQDYATKDLLVNDLVWYAGDLYRVTRDIPIGSKYIPGTNLIKTTIESLLVNYYGRDRTAEVSNETVIVKNNSIETITNEKNIKAKDIVLNPENPLTYKTPEDLSTYFKSVKFKDKNNNIYDVLVNLNVKKLESLISGIFYAENVNSMIADTNITNNSIVLTACYSLLNDGGNGVYAITDSKSDFSITLSNGLYANLLYTDCCSILQFGANVSKDDNTAEIQKAIDFSVSKHIKLYVPNGTYKVKNLIAKENLYMFGEGYNSVLNLTEGSFAGDPDKFNYFLNGCIRDIALLGNQELNSQNGFDMSLMRATLENTFVKYFNGVAYNLQQAKGTGEYEYQILVNNGENHGLYYANAIFCGTGFVLTQYDGFYVNLLSSRCKNGLQASSAKILNAHIWGYERHGCRLGTGQYTNIEIEAATVPNPVSTLLIEEGIVNINNLYLWNIATDSFYIWTNENTHLIINGISVGSKGNLNSSDKTLLKLIGGNAKHVYVTGFIDESFTNGNLVNVATQNSYSLFVGSPQLTDATRTRVLTKSIDWTGTPLNLLNVFPDLSLSLSKIIKTDILNEEGNTMCLLYEFNNVPFLNIVKGNSITEQYPAKTLTLSLTIIP